MRRSPGRAPCSAPGAANGAGPEPGTLLAFWLGACAAPRLAPRPLRPRPCRADGAEGFELCYEGAWSECLAEACEEEEAGRDCEGGRQYCKSEGGAELFGGATRLASGGRARNGFEALAELDSDGDRQITPADGRWGELVLWADYDGDRRSSGWELLPLASFEVRAIELDYVSRRECDAAGNCGIERARFVFGAGRRGEVVDVHGACK